MGGQLAVIHQERKRHININSSGDCPGGGGSPDRVARGLPTGGQGSKVYVLCAEPKEHKQIRQGTRPGGFGYPAGRIGDRADQEIVYVPNVYVPFPAPNSGGRRGSKTPGRLLSPGEAQLSAQPRKRQRL